jgi:hypothetical protein
MRWVLLLALLAGADSAEAQGTNARVDRVRAGFTLGLQADTTPLSQASMLTEYVEPTPVVAASAARAMPWFDTGVTVTVVGRLGIAVSVSYLSHTSTARVEADIPHPFFFNRRRAISGQVDDVRHGELATHLDAVYLLPWRRLDVALSGGASVLRVEQSFVSDVDYAESYPYDAAGFRAATLTTQTRNATGYNAGVDVTWKVSPMWGVGALVRYTGATIPFATTAIDFGSHRAGGLQVGAGVRVKL